MSKRYRPWKIDEPMLLPARVQDQLETMPEEVFGQRLFEATLAEFDLSNPEEVRRWEAFVAAANALAKDRRPSD